MESNDMLRRMAEERAQRTQLEQELKSKRDAALVYLRSVNDERKAPEDVLQREADQIVKAIEWLEAKWGATHGCPYCGNEQWEVGTPVEITTGRMAATPVFGALSPAFPVMCTNCGNTVFINAIRAGIMPEPDQR